MYLIYGHFTTSHVETVLELSLSDTVVSSSRVDATFTAINSTYIVAGKIPKTHYPYIPLRMRHYHFDTSDNFSLFRFKSRELFFYRCDILLIFSIVLFY